MNLSAIASGSSVFVDANIFIYAFAPDQQLGPNCEQLLERIELHDLHGNVWEWCHDGFDADAYRGCADGDPDTGHESREKDYRNGLEPLLKSDQSRVLRGGSWYYPAGYCRSAFRSWFRPDVRNWDFGFRVCLVRGPAAQPASPAEPATGDAGRGTRPESDGAGGAGSAAPDLARATFPRAAGPKKLE